LPQAAELVPGWHLLAWQHPDAQVLGPQLWESLQIPRVHVSVAPHTWHAAPWSPQASFRLPSLQTVPSQQPAQVVVEQVPPLTQEPATHPSEVPHFLHGRPPAPQAAAMVPGRQVLPSQQPLQAAALQAQVWLSHLWVEEQVAQSAPPLPQASLPVPGWHSSSWQQPSGQVSGVHLAPSAMHCPCVQTSLA
jgi:hypothetical protein